MIQDAVLIAVAYIVGSVPMAYIVGRAVKGVDLRRRGSGTLGGTNVWEVVGKKWVGPVGGFDYLVKGVGMVALARFGFDEGAMVQGLVGLAAVGGHNWSLYLRFTGGRGVAAGLGALTLLSWQQLAILASIGLIGKFVFRATGLAVMVAVLLLPITSTVMYLVYTTPLGVVAFCWGFALLTVLKRAMANNLTRPPHLSWPRVLYNRILFDRDVSDRDEWVSRSL